MPSNVFIAFQNSEDARYLIEAIVQDNVDAEIERYPAMVKINSPGRLVIKRETVEELIGREWDPQEIHVDLISLNGDVEEDDDFFMLQRGV